MMQLRNQWPNLSIHAASVQAEVFLTGKQINQLGQDVRELRLAAEKEIEIAAPTENDATRSVMLVCQQRGLK